VTPRFVSLIGRPAQDFGDGDRHTRLGSRFSARIRRCWWMRKTRRSLAWRDKQIHYRQPVPQGEKPRQRWQRSREIVDSGPSDRSGGSACRKTCGSPMCLPWRRQLSRSIAACCCGRRTCGVRAAQLKRLVTGLRGPNLCLLREHLQNLARCWELMTLTVRANPESRQREPRP